MKLTPKQEAFCHAYVETGNASEAYRRSYDAKNMKPSTVNRKAKFELDKGKIGARLAELQAQITADHEITVAEIAQGLRRAAAGAEAGGNWSAVVQATMGLARLGGLLVEKRHVQVDDQAAHLMVLRELSAVPQH